MGPRQILRELLSNGPGKAGVALLLLLIALSAFALVRFPLDFGRTRWSNPAEWADNPKNAPPVWANLLTSRDEARHRKLRAPEPSEVTSFRSGEVRTYRLPFDFDSDAPPTFITLGISSVAYHDRPPILAVSVARPDGTEALLYRQVVRGPNPGETAPFQRFHEAPLRVALTADPSVQQAMSDFFFQSYDVDLPPDILRNVMTRALFGVPDPAAPDGLRLLRGRYHFIVAATLSDPRDSLESVEFVLGGSVFGLMGTDGLGRDLASALLFGLPVALFIGVVASVATTAIGASLGIISGYMGGKTDMVIQRLADVVANVPLLPLLIFLVFILGSNLLLIIFILVAFSWPGLTILIRSMVLQLRSGQLIESAVALGASRWRIMYRHVFPHTAPFVFAQMIFFAPAAILAEAGLSFLGLGDPSIPTWGQVLESGFRTGAVFLGYWWWVIPPGVLIIITAVTFMLLALGMEPVVNPRLRRTG